MKEFKTKGWKSPF